jgi:PleD family two-component response regulator
MQRALSNELRVAGVRVREARVGRLATSQFNNHTFEMILSSLWTDVVEPVLNGLAFNVRPQ